MAVTISKIRLGAPSLFQLGGTQDMGATKGGVMLKYNRNQLLVECDQFLAPVQVFTTKEDCSCEAAFYETQMGKWVYIIGLNGLGNVVTAGSSPTVDTFSFGGQVQVATTYLDLTIPKNDGTANNILVHLNKVHGFKELSVDFARDKESTVKGVFNALADTTQVAGLQLGYIKEQY